MNEPEKRIIHLYIPKEFRVYCMPRKVPSAAIEATKLPSKATCVNCLTNLRYATGQGKHGPFKVAWTDNHKPMSMEPKLED